MVTMKITIMVGFVLATAIVATIEVVKANMKANN